MLILVPLKPVVLILSLLSGLILFGFIGSSLLETTNPFPIGTRQMQHTVGKPNDSNAAPEHAYGHRSAAKHAH